MNLKGHYCSGGIKWFILARGRMGVSYPDWAVYSCHAHWCKMRYLYRPGIDQPRLRDNTACGDDCLQKCDHDNVSYGTSADVVDSQKTFRAFIYMKESCANHCSYCRWPTPTPGVNDNVPLETLRKFCADMSPVFRDCTASNITLTGGECFLHPKLEEVCSSLIELVPNLNLFFLTSLPSSRKLKRLVLSVGGFRSLYFHASCHPTGRGFYLNDFIESLSFLREREMTPVVYLVDNEINRPFIAHYSDLFKSVGARMVILEDHLDHENRDNVIRSMLFDGRASFKKI